MEITFQTSTNITYNHVIEKIEHLTFPPIRKKVLTMPIHEPYTGIWAIKENKIIGIILADNPKQGISELFSFYVIPEERQKGLGNQLLTLLENFQKKQGIIGIQSRYRSDWRNIAAIEKMISRHGWTEPQLVRIIAETSIDKYFLAPWPQVKLPQDYSVFNWLELSKEDESGVLELIKTGGVPKEFDPFQHTESLFLPSCLGLKYNGKVIGWNMAYRLKDDTIEYNNLFIADTFRNKGYAIALLYKSFGEQFKLSIPKATWIINAGNTPILKIANRIAEKFLDKIVEVKGTGKRL